MRSRVAFFLVLVLAGFVVGAAWDRCAESEEECAPLCHAGCLDNCATAPVPRIQSRLGVLETVLSAPNTPSLEPLARSESPDIQPPRA